MLTSTIEKAMTTSKKERLRPHINQLSLLQLVAIASRPFSAFLCSKIILWTHFLLSVFGQILLDIVRGVHNYPIRCNQCWTSSLLRRHLKTKYKRACDWSNTAVNGSLERLEVRFSLRLCGITFVVIHSIVTRVIFVLGRFPFESFFSIAQFFSVYF